jgi:bifunctional non-homologous end joining protein LigD
LGGAKLDDDKKQLEVKCKRLEAKSETESVPLKEEDVLKAQVAFEERLEGYRMPGDVRAGNDFSGRFPFIAMAVSKLPVRSCLIDGEACVCDENGLAVFDLIRRHGALANAVLCAFDLLELDGQDLRRHPIEKRKELLAELLCGSQLSLVFNENFDADGAIVYREACRLGCEGIVSKRLGSPYRSGRSAHWVKVKNPKAPAVKREAEEDWGR